MKKIMLATGNAHKVEEFQKMLKPYGYEVLCLKDMKEDVEIIEDGKTFQENALIKARTIHDILGIEVIADDSGLAVNAMDGAPGIYSARFLGEDTTYDIKNQYIIDQVNGKDDRGCQFVCALAYVNEQGESVVFEGVVEGFVNDQILGSNGFGYDPIFYYPPYQTTLANVDDEKKNAVSHRGKAIQLFLNYLKEGK